jgi:protein TonB
LKESKPIFGLSSAWWISLALHGFVIASSLAVFAIRSRATENIEFQVIENPKVAAPTLQVDAKPIERPPEAVSRKVFGISRKSVTTDDSTGESVKQGNTVAKTPDDEKLKDSDLDQLPIPTDDYLVSAMPQLMSEVRIPYPPEAKAKGIEGPVVMDILIDDKGVVRKATLVSGPGVGLNEAALNAIRGFSFKAAEVSGKSVAVRIRYTYRFVLER